MKSLKTLFLFYTIIVFCSCNKEEIQPKLELSDYVFNFTGESGLQTFYLKTNTAWEIDVPENWCTITPLSGKISNNSELTVSVVKNTSYYPRDININIKIKTKDLSDYILFVHQRGKPYLNIPQTDYELDSQHHFFKFEIELRQGHFEVESNVDWLSDYGFVLLSHISNKWLLTYRIDCVVEENSSTAEREGILTITQDNLSKTVTVKQAGKP